MMQVQDLFFSVRRIHTDSQTWTTRTPHFKKTERCQLYLESHGCDVNDADHSVQPLYIPDSRDVLSPGSFPWPLNRTKDRFNGRDGSAIRARCRKFIIAIFFLVSVDVIARGCGTTVCQTLGRVCEVVGNNYLSIGGEREEARINI